MKGESWPGEVYGLLEVIVIALPLGIIAAAVAAYAFQRGRRRKRMEGLMAFAEEIGVDFHGGKAGPLPDEFGVSILVNAGSLPVTYQLLEGPLGPGSISVFDLEFSRTAHGRLYQNYLTVCAFYTGWRCATLRVRPEGMMEKAEALFGMKDMQVGDEDFDRRWHIRTSYEGFARAVLTEPVREFFTARPGLNLELYRDFFLLYYTPKFLGFFYSDRLKTCETIRLVDDALKFAELIGSATQPQSPSGES